MWMNDKQEREWVNVRVTIPKKKEKERDGEAEKNLSFDGCTIKVKEERLNNGNKNTKILQSF